ncbi:MAG: PAS domain-containing protein [Planctomycetaceae bacterium]|nr:PAS domain-containing protein [Planctomycetaceae bacterium]
MPLDPSSLHQLTDSEVQALVAQSEQIRTLESRRRLAQELANLGFWELDLVNNRLYWCDEIYRIFEVTPAEFGASYESFLGFVHPDDREFVDTSYRDSVKLRKSYNIAHRLLLQDGRIKWVNERGRTQYNDAGQPVRSCGTVLDITEIKELEQELFQTQKMETLGRFASGIAHDINNYLTGISGWSEVLKQSAVCGQEETIRNLQHAVRRCTALTDQLLAFSRNEPVRFTPVSLTAVLEEVIPLLRNMISDDIHIEISNNIDDACILGDQTRITQILMNLVSNAVDAVSGHGTIHVSTRMENRQCPAIATGPQSADSLHDVLIEVSDDGPGIPKDVLPRIFDPMFTSKPRGKGTGLGLAIVHGAVQQHHGQITVKSSPSGSGTTFQVFLPIEPKGTALPRPRQG